MRAKNKKVAEENPFADLEQFNSRQAIQDAYGWELITKAEMDRLNALWDAREASLSTTEKYEDRVALMLEKALNGIGDEYIEQLMDFRELERKMQAEAECIARENR